MSESLLKRNIAEARTMLESLEGLDAPLAAAADLIERALVGGHKLLVCGNGGSAADAMHFATEFVCRFIDDRRPYPALCLNASGGDLTAAGNDYCFEDAFARQVQAFGRAGDVLVVFTTSGNSENILRALDAAGEVGLASIALLGRDGGPAKGRATVDLLVPHHASATIQEGHKVLLHTLCGMVEPALQAGGLK